MKYIELFVVDLVFFFFFMSSPVYQYGVAYTTCPGVLLQAHNLVDVPYLLCARWTRATAWKETNPTCPANQGFKPVVSWLWAKHANHHTTHPLNIMVSLIILMTGLVFRQLNMIRKIF